MSKIFRPSLGVLCLLLLAWPNPAGANSIQYTYTGHPFDQGVGTAPPGVDSIRGFFVLDTPLAPNRTLFSGNVTPASLSFTDGFHTVNDFNGLGAGLPDIMQIATDALGHITLWRIILWTPCTLLDGATCGAVGLSTIDNGGSVLQDSVDSLELPSDARVYGRLILDDPGTWTETAAVPEPATVILMGAAGLAGLARRRRRRTTAP